MTTVHDLSVNIADAVTEAKNILQQIIEYPINVWVTGVAVCFNNKRVIKFDYRGEMHIFSLFKALLSHPQGKISLLLQLQPHGEWD